VAPPKLVPLAFFRQLEEMLERGDATQLKPITIRGGARLTSLTSSFPVQNSPLETDISLR